MARMIFANFVVFLSSVELFHVAEGFLHKPMIELSYIQQAFHWSTPNVVLWLVYVHSSWGIIENLLFLIMKNCYL